MSEADLIRLVKRIVKEQLAPIMLASVTDNQDQFRVDAQRNATDSVLQRMRNISNFGFASRAPSGTPTVLVPVAADPTHLLSMGHFDANRPAINDGECILYSSDGQVIYFKNDGTIHQGIQGAASPVVLGDVLQTLEDNVLGAWINNDSVIAYDGLGLPCVLNPAILTILENEKSNHVDNPSTNFLGQKNFVDRGA